MKLGFIGAGKMASALAEGILAAGIAEEKNVWASDADSARLAQFRKRFPQANTTGKNNGVVKNCGAVFICVKPQDVCGVLRGIRSSATHGNLFVSIAAGVSLAMLESELPEARIVRVMPNIAAMSGEAMSAFSLGRKATSHDREFVRGILGAVGKEVEVREELMHAVTALSGSGPAFVALVVEALARGGMEKGIPEETAYLLANQTALGTAKLMMGKKIRPHELIGMVKSPKGTTEAGLKFLEAQKIGKALAGAVHAAEKRSRELEKC